MDKSNKESENKDLNNEMNLKIKSKSLIYISIGLAFIFLISGSLYIYQKYYIERGSSDIPTAQELKERAAKRYQEIRGISFEEENLVSRNLASAVDAQQSFLSGNSANTTSDPKVRILTEETAKKVSEKVSNNTSDVYYYEIEVIANKNPENNSIFPFYFGQSPLINYTKPFNIKNWVSACSNKTVLSQDQKVINFGSYTNTSNISYLGGKYAVKSVYNDADSGYGCFSSNVFSNPELEFVKAILSDSGTFKQVGTETINGVKTVIYEQSYSDIIPLISSVVDNKALDSIASQNKIRYFVDTSKLQVVRTQYLDKDTLIYTQNLISSMKIGSTDGQNQIKSTEELRNIEIKEVKVDLTKQIYNEETKIRDAMKLFPVLYLNQPNETVNYIYVTPEVPIDEYSKLTQTIDFDPSWDENQKLIETNYVPSFASYGGNGYSMIVYKKQPTQTSKGTKRTPKEILIDGKKVNAELIKYDYADPELRGGETQGAPAVDTLIAPAPDNFGSIEFQYQNVWYALGFYGWKSGSSVDPATQQISLSTMTNEKADQIDARKEFIKNAQPRVSFKNELKNIPSDSRYLPGSLKSNYKMEASYVIMDASPNTKSNCTELKKEERIYSEEICLIDNFDGFEIVFGEQAINTPETQIDGGLKGNEDMSTSSSSGIIISPYGVNQVTYLVFKASYADLKPYLAQISNYQEGATYDYREVNGYTIVLNSSILTKADRKAVLDAAKVDYGFADIDNELKKNSVSAVRGL